MAELRNGWSVGTSAPLAWLKDHTQQVFTSRLTRATLLCLAFAGLTMVMTWPQAAHMDEVRDHFDPPFSIWRLEWVAHQILYDPVRLFDANIFHPAPLTLAFSDAMLLPALLVAPVLWFGASGPIVYNVVLLSAFALSGIAMFVLVNRLTGQAGAALVAGVIFAFSPFRFEHYHHLELQFVLWIPLTLYFLARTAQTGRLRDGLLVGTCVMAQIFSSIYYGVFLAAFCAFGGLGWLAASMLNTVRRWSFSGSVPPPTTFTRRTAVGLGAGMLLTFALTALYARPYVRASQALGGMRSVEKVQEHSARPVNYLASPPHNLLYGWTADRFGGNELNLFPGGIAILLAIVGCWRPRSRATLLTAIGAAVAFDWSLGFNGILYPWLYTYATPFRGLRVPARGAIFVSFFLALLAGYGLARLLGGIRTRAWRSALIVGILLAVCLEYWTKPLERVELSRTPPDVYRLLQQLPNSVILELPVAEPDVFGISLDVFYMYYSTFHWHRLLNGYSGFLPPHYTRLLEILRTFPDERSIRELRLRNADYVLVHSGMNYWSFKPEEGLQQRLDASRDFARVGCYRGPRGQSCIYKLLKG
jgi:hypothetical protein